MASVFKRGGKANRTGKWYVQWFDHNGKRRSRCSGTTDKATAERIAKKLEADAAMGSRIAANNRRGTATLESCIGRRVTSVLNC